MTSSSSSCGHSNDDDIMYSCSVYLWHIPLPRKPDAVVILVCISIYILQYMKREDSYPGIKQIVTQLHLGVRQLTKNRCFCTLSQQLLFSSEVRTTAHVSNDGKERVSASIASGGNYTPGSRSFCDVVVDCVSIDQLIHKNSFLCLYIV